MDYFNLKTNPNKKTTPETMLNDTPTPKMSAKKPKTIATKEANMVFVSDSTERVVARDSDLKVSATKATPIGFRKFSTKYIKTKNRTDNP